MLFQNKPKYLILYAFDSIDIPHLRRARDSLPLAGLNPAESGANPKANPAYSVTLIVSSEFQTMELILEFLRAHNYQIINRLE